MHHIFGILLIMIALLTACAAPRKPGDQFIKTRASLAEASYAVSRSMVDLAEVAQAAHPLSSLDQPPPPSTYGMGGPTSIDWSGPVEPLVRQIARVSDYRLRVLGTPPAIPVIVTIYERHAKLGDVLRDVAYQCNKRASIIIFPESRVIELRYAKN